MRWALVKLGATDLRAPAGRGPHTLQVRAAHRRRVRADHDHARDEPRGVVAVEHVGVGAARLFRAT
eukprot:13484325-Alexandrium_andersonii.AAC.1